MRETSKQVCGKVAYWKNRVETPFKKLSTRLIHMDIHKMCVDCAKKKGREPPQPFDFKHKPCYLWPMATKRLSTERTALLISPSLVSNTAIG